MAVVTYLEALRQALAEEMARDERVFLIGEDIATYGGAFKVTEGLADRFGAARVVDTPISESAIVGAAVGAAYMGMRPVAEMQFGDFVSIAFDQLITCAAKMHYRIGWAVPMVVRCPNGGGVGGGHIDQDFTLGTQQLSRNAWHLVVAPEIGAEVRGGPDRLFVGVFSLRYNVPVAAGDYLGGGSRKFQYLTLRVGIGEE